MKKIILKISLLFAAILFIINLASCKSISKDDAKANLEGAGYKVEIMDGDEYSDSDKNEFAITSIDLEYYLFATKDSEQIHIFFFISTDAASNNEPFISFSNLSSGQTNNVLYYGTKQAIKDAKI